MSSDTTDEGELRALREAHARLLTYLRGLQADGSDVAAGIATDVLFIIGEKR